MAYSQSIAAPDRGERGPAVPDKRRTADGILWVLRTGAPWRDVPERYGNWNSVFMRFTRWSKLGVWDAVFETPRASRRRRKCHRFDDRAGAPACSRRKRRNQNQEALGRATRSNRERAPNVILDLGYFIGKLGRKNLCHQIERP